MGSDAVPERDVALRDPVEDPVGPGLGEPLVVDKLLEARFQVGREPLREVVLGDVPVVGQIGNLLAFLQVGDQGSLRDAEHVGL